jgi:hypothetical protein
LRISAFLQNSRKRTSLRKLPCLWLWWAMNTWPIGTVSVPNFWNVFWIDKMSCVLMFGLHPWTKPAPREKGRCLFSVLLRTCIYWIHHVHCCVSKIQ